MNAAAHPVPLCQWVCFTLDALRFALPLDSVVRIVQAAEVAALPMAPATVAGVLDVAGRILPVYDLRRRLRLPERQIGIGDQFLIAQTARRPVALVVDRALGLIDASPADAQPALELSPRHFRGVLSLPDGLALIENLDDFLSSEEEEALESALRAAGKACTPTP